MISTTCLVGPRLHTPLFWLLYRRPTWACIRPPSRFCIFCWCEQDAHFVITRSVKCHSQRFDLDDAVKPVLRQMVRWASSGWRRSFLMTQGRGMKILILGATGLVGATALQQALADPRVEQVVAPSRRSLTAHRKLVNPVAPKLDSLLADVANWNVDSVICAMGTTPAKAGSKEAFRHIDYELPIAFAELAHKQGAGSFALVSSPGASLSIPVYYCRVKGEAERDIASIGFKSLTIVRPGMIGGDRAEFRLAERIVMPIAAVLQPLLPRGLHINPAARIAAILVAAAVAPIPGRHMITSKDIVGSPLGGGVRLQPIGRQD